MMMLDYLIVGQGIAGTCLAQRLLDRNCKISIFDNNHKNSSSMAAAGIINPITGRYYAKSWLIDDLLPEADAFYQQMEEKLRIDFLRKTSVIRTFHDIKGENNWWARMDKQGYDAYMSAQPDLGMLAQMIRPPFGFGEVLQARQINLYAFLKRFREYNSDIVLAESFSYNDLEILENSIEYRGRKSRAIVFAEGYRAIKNPFFQHLPFQPVKGEALIIKIPEYDGPKILRDKIFLCPMGDHLYWVGSGYDRKNLNETITTEERDRLMEKLEAFLNVDYQVVDQKAGVRPATKDRRPLLGVHPEYPHLFLFNGMGTKGTSLSPYWSEKMVAFMEEGKELPEEVNISRFDSSR